MIVHAVKDASDIHEQTWVGSGKVHQFVIFEPYLEIWLFLN